MNCRIGPDSVWSLEALAQRLADVRLKQGYLLGRMQALGSFLRAEAVLQTLTLDVLKSSEIEGEALDRDQVRSSVARRLGVDVGALAPGDRNVDGVVEMMLDATQNYEKPLTKERLLGWHASLFPTGCSGLRRINVGAWRDDATGRCRSYQDLSAANGCISKRLTPHGPFNERQRLLLNKLLDGFDGKLTSSKWARIAKCSQDTALRDILDLVKRGILTRDAAGGRSASYSLKELSQAW